MAKGRLIWCLIMGVLLAGMMGAGSCGKKAMDQINSASIAVEDARIAEAPKYAPEEFKSAEDTLAEARDLYDRNRFRKSEATALAAENRAKVAMDLAVEEREKFLEEKRWEAERELALQRSTLYEEQPSEEELAKSVLRDIHFGFDSPQLSNAAMGVLDLNVTWLMEHPSVKVEIEGHCDNRGADEYNLALGAKRAKMVYNYMISKGVDSSRMKTISYGESLPVDRGETEEAWAKNRRVHFAAMVQ